MNVETTSVRNLSDQNQSQVKPQNQSDSQVKFSDELKELKKDENKTEKNTKAPTENKTEEDTKASAENKTEINSKTFVEKQETKLQEKPEKNEHLHANNDKKIFTVQHPVEGNTVPDELNSAVKGLNDILSELNQKDEKKEFEFKPHKNLTDIENKGDELINNDFNVHENKDLLPQMNPNMNFGGDGQPFSSLMNSSQQSKNNNQPDSTAKDLAEEAQILSTMAENIAMVNKIEIEEPQEKTVIKNDGIKKIDTHTGITQETIVKFDSVIMNEADVEVFVNLVNNGEADIQNLAPEALQKSVNVSKTLADMLAKAMEDNKPIRIDFDNDISVIIKISRDGKLTADFLPSSQVAEAYLKENLPLLKQRFDDENIEYNELNQRERQGNEKDQRKKKDSNNE